MNEAEKAQQQMNLITDAVAAVKFAAEEERRVTHAKRIDPRYQEALECLEIKLTAARSYAYLVQRLENEI